MSYQVLARKYRPQTFEQIIGQDHITRTLKNAIQSERIAHGYLFSGMRGVGKTTTARVLAKALNCDAGPTPEPCNRCPSCTEITDGYSVDVIEIDGASNTGVDDIRELRENVLYAPARSRYKIYIIDEVHMLSKSAFNALLKTLEEPPPHVIFIFATTETHKVPITIQSRCQCFDFRRIQNPALVDHLLSLAKQEGFALDGASAHLIAKASEGSLRDAQSLLDQVVSFAGEKLNPVDTRVVLGTMDQEVLDQARQALIQQNPQDAMNVVDTLVRNGQDLVEFCKTLLSHLRDLLMVKILQDPTSVTALTQEEIEALRPAADAIEEDRLLSFLEHLNRTEERVRRSTQPRFALEVALVKMTRVEPLRDFKAVLSQIESLERRLGPSGVSAKPAGRAEHRSAAPRRTRGTQRLARSDAPEGNTIDWEAVVGFANTESPVVGSILEQGFLDAADAGRIVIGFKKKIHFNRALEKQGTVQDVLRRFLNRQLIVDFTLHNGSDTERQTLKEKKDARARQQHAKVAKENLDHPVVQDALKIFKGRILEVREFRAADGQGR